MAASSEMLRLVTLTELLNEEGDVLINQYVINTTALGFLKEFRPTSGEHFDTDVINTKPQSQRLTCAKNQCIKLIEYYGIDHKDEERFSLSMTDAQRLHELCSCQRKCRVQYMESKWIEVWHLVITYSCNESWCVSYCPVRVLTTARTTTKTETTSIGTDKNSIIASAIAAPLAVVLCTIVVIAVIVFLYKRSNRRKPPQTYIPEIESKTIVRQEEDGGFSNPSYSTSQSRPNDEPTGSGHIEMNAYSVISDDTKDKYNTLNERNKPSQRDTGYSHIVHSGNTRSVQYDHVKGSFSATLPNYNHFRRGPNEIGGPHFLADSSETGHYNHLQTNKSAHTIARDKDIFDMNYSHLKNARTINAVKNLPISTAQYYKGKDDKYENHNLKTLSFEQAKHDEDVTTETHDYFILEKETPSHSGN